MQNIHFRRREGWVLLNWRDHSWLHLFRRDKVVCSNITMSVGRGGGGVKKWGMMREGEEVEMMTRGKRREWRKTTEPKANENRGDVRQRSKNKDGLKEKAVCCVDVLFHHFVSLAQQGSACVFTVVWLQAGGINKSAKKIWFEPARASICHFQ